MKRASLLVALFALSQSAHAAPALVDVTGEQRLVLAPLTPPLVESPLARGIPKRVVPSRVALMVRELDEAKLRGARPDGRLQPLLDDIGRAQGLSLRFVRALSFGWAVYDVTAAGSDARLSEEETLRAVERLRADPRVERASEDPWRRALATPNDPGMPYTWHYDAIEAELAWDTATGDSGQRVGVVDTGTLRDHQDLSSKDAHGYDFISYSEISNDGDARDADYQDPGDGGDCGGGSLPDSWHGSHVAGTILASTGNGLGIAGINWGAKLVTGRALGRCGGDGFDILEAIAWMAGYQIDGVPNITAADVVDVINLSLGEDAACSDVERSYISQIMAETDVVFVAAAGNSGNGAAVGSPANCPGVISVGAHGPGAGRPLAPYSNWGSDLDIIAPGGDQQSSGVAEDGVLSLCGPTSDCYMYSQGTSMASPHVTGAASLLRAANPTLTAAEILELMRGNGESCGGCDGVPALRLDLAVEAAASAPGGGGLPPPDDGDPGDGDPGDDGTDPGGGGTVPGGGGGGPTPVSECDARRGNWDCPNDTGCIENTDGIGRCVPGAEGDRGSGGLCETDLECASGLCDRGVCTVPCDGGCRDGYGCDDELIPGGMCRAESCAASEGAICGGGWHCAYSSANRYVCAAEGDDVFAPAACAQRGSSSLWPLVALALFGALLRRRRARA